MSHVGLIGEHAKATLRRLFPPTPIGCVRGGVLVLIALIIIFVRTIWTLDELFLLFLVIFALFGQGKEYIKRFLPFVLILLAYDSLRSLVPLVTHRVHYTEMINFDRWFGHGTLPTVWLQNHFYHGHLQWYDFYFYFLYMAHFLIPFFFAIIVWKTHPKQYWYYVVALSVLSYIGFITYVIFPAAPPWLASQMGLIPHIEKLSTDIWWAFGVHNFPSIYEKLSPNLVAAVPSLHAAYPALTTLYVWRFYGWKIALPVLIWPLSVWVGVVYLGEHYVFDVLLGILYAIVVYFASNWTMDYFINRREAGAQKAS